MTDLRCALRSLWTGRPFTTIAVLTLALAIGANAAIFSIVRGVLLAPLPYRDPSRLVMLSESNHAKGLEFFGVSSPDFRDWLAQSDAFDELAAYSTNSANLAGGDRPERVRLAGVTARFFSVFGTHAVAGRLFQSDDDDPGREPVVVLGAGLWQRRFGGRPDVAGQSIVLGGRPYVVVGVVGEEFRFPDQVDVWTPLPLAADRSRRGARWLSVVAKLRAGTSVSGARARINDVQQRLARQYPDSDSGWTVDLVPLRDAIVGDYRTAVLLLWGAVGFVLLIACVNIANLFLARATDRQKEMLIRGALGASTARVVRQLVVEGTVLGTVASAAGVVLGRWMLDGLKWLSPAGAPRAHEISMDATVVCAAMLLGLAASVSSGIAPAWGLRRLNLRDAIAAAAPSLSAGRRMLRVRHALVAGEIAVAMVLSTGAGLLVRSLAAMLATHPGFDAHGVLTFRVAPPQSMPAPGESEQAFMARYLVERDRMDAFYREAIATLDAIPGVQSAGAINRLPLSGNWWTDVLSVEGRPVTAGEELAPKARVITPGYFAAMHVPILQGRDVAASDRSDGLRVALVSQSLARFVSEAGDPVGKRICLCRTASQTPTWLTIVGVVGNVRQSQLTVAAEPTVYVPLAQATSGFFPDWGMDVVLRARSDPMSLAGRVRTEFRKLDDQLPLFQMQTLDDLISQGVERERFLMVVFSAFATGALLLAALGIFGVACYAVSARSREFAIRLAVGAAPAAILRMVMATAVSIGTAGILFGLPAAIACSRLMRSTLYQVEPSDPATYLAVSALALACALLACYVPARRATRLDPIVALRSD